MHNKIWKMRPCDNLGYFMIYSFTPLSNKRLTTPPRNLYYSPLVFISEALKPEFCFHAKCYRIHPWIWLLLKYFAKNPNTMGCRLFLNYISYDIILQIGIKQSQGSRPLFLRSVPARPAKKLNIFYVFGP